MKILLNRFFISIIIYSIISFIFPFIIYSNQQVENIWTDTTMINDTEIEGELLVKGIINIQAGVTLTIKPGTKIKFIKVDSDNNEIGEGGIYIQGTLNAKGTKENPIIFTSAEKNPQKGDWDNVFFIVSEGENNIAENCQVEYSYRGIHSHFSKVKVKNVFFQNNLRAMQFQESVVKVENAIFKNNNSAIRFRDSDVEISNSIFEDNYSAINFLRSNIKISGNTITNCMMEGIRSRESAGTIENNQIIKNRYGINLKESNLNIKQNLINNNVENAISLKFCSTSVAERNYIEYNGGHGFSIENSNIKIEQNNIISSGKYNIYMLDKSNISSINNWWGCTNESYIKSKIYDFSCDTSLPVVNYFPFLIKPWK